MSPVRADRVAETAEERMLQRITDLERSIEQLRRERIVGIQRAYDEELGEVSLTGSSGLGESFDLGGPSCTVHVEPGQIVLVGWQGEIKAGAQQAAIVTLYEPTDFPETFVWEPDHITLGYWQNSNVYKKGGTNALTIFPLDFDAQHDTASDAPVPIMAAFPATPGDRTYSLRYAREGNNNTAYFRNRKLWVVVV